MDALNMARPSVRKQLGKVLFENLEDYLQSFIHHFPKFPLLRDLMLWRNFVSSQFVVHSFIEEGTILIDTKDNEHRAYQVKGLYESLEELLRRQQKCDQEFKLPVVIETVLLPFQGGITYNTTFEIVTKSAEELNAIKKEYDKYYLTHLENGSIVRFQQIKGLMKDMLKEKA